MKTYFSWSKTVHYYSRGVSDMQKVETGSPLQRGIWEDFILLILCSTILYNLYLLPSIASYNT